MNGYIKLFRKITNWEWYTDTNTFRVFIHLLLMANHEDQKWRGMVIKRGQRVTSLNHLSQELGLSKQQIRTAISHLISTQEITCETTHKHTVITVENYDSYQGGADEDNTLANTRCNTVSTLNKNDKNKRIKEYNNIHIVEKPEENTAKTVIDHLNERAGTHYRHNTGKTKTLIRARLNEGFSVEDFRIVIDKKCDEWLGTDMQKFLRPETLFGTKFEGYLNQQTKKTTGNAFLDLLQGGEI